MESQATTNAPILICDDDPSFQTLCEIVFQTKGIPVILAGTVKEALMLLKKHHNEIKFSLIDFILPDGTGKDLITLVKNEIPAIDLDRVMVFSNFPPDSPQAESIRSANVKFLEKPSSLEQFDELIKVHYS